jgi:hypothetical protein
MPLVRTSGGSTFLDSRPVSKSVGSVRNNGPGAVGVGSALLHSRTASRARYATGLPAERSALDFIAITADHGSDEIEGIAA